MSDPLCTPGEVARLVDESGYPFELQVATRLQELGFRVHLSHQFFDTVRERPAEVDVLATREYDCDTSHAGRVKCVFELAIECKDNSLPYVLFGFPAPPPPDRTFLDGDVYYTKVRSTQDKFPNYFSLVSLGESGVPSTENLKAAHHFFAGSHRFHQAASIERTKEGQAPPGRLKLHVAERFRDSLHGLAGYVHFVQETLFKAKSAFDRAGYSHDPTLWLTYLLLVHRGKHYRYLGSGSLREVPHTTLLTSVSVAGTSSPYAVDFVQFSGLADAVATIEATFHLVSKNLVRYVVKSPNPRTQSA